MTLNELITIALKSERADEAVYAAQDQFCREHVNERGQILDVRSNAVLDILKRRLLFVQPFSQDERIILEGLMIKDEVPQATTGTQTQANNDDSSQPFRTNTGYRLQDNQEGKALGRYKLRIWACADGQLGFAVKDALDSCQRRFPQADIWVEKAPLNSTNKVVGPWKKVQKVS